MFDVLESRPILRVIRPEPEEPELMEEHLAVYVATVRDEVCEVGNDLPALLTRLKQEGGETDVVVWAWKERRVVAIVDHLGKVLLLDSKVG